MKEDDERNDSKIGYWLLTCFSYVSFIRGYRSFFDTSWKHARSQKDARAFSIFWTYVRLYSKPTTARTQWHYGSTIFPVEDGIISKLHLKGLQEQRILWKVGITEYKHFLNAITQCYGLFWKGFKNICRCNEHHFNKPCSDEMSVIHCHVIKHLQTT